MIRGFTFERALSWPFSAPHVASFPWIFGAAYAGISMLVVVLIGAAAYGDFMAWISAIESLENQQGPDLSPAEVFGQFALLVPWIALSAFAFWIVWAMFETASQRRYIWGKPFSLGFGRDERNMMIVGLLWGLMGIAIMALPVLMIFGGMWAAIAAEAEGLTDAEAGQRIVAPMFGAAGLMLLLLPAYAFMATRLAPCFGLTVKEGRIRFFDAWNVSRGRFWAIFGAYVILAVAGGIASQVLSGIAQVIILPSFMSLSNAAENGQDVMALLASPGFLVPMGVFLFVSQFLQGLLQHVVGGPAAFAARHDPRGGVEDDAKVDAFS